MLNILNLLFPEKCVVCDTTLNDKSVICPKCLAKTFQYYGENQQLDLDYLALFKYSAEMKKLIEVMKYHHHKPALKLLQEQIIINTPVDYSGFDLIIPIPLNPIRHQERGFNQSEELIRPFSLFRNIPLRNDIVYRGYNTEKLHSLSPQKRSHELQDSFNVWENKEVEVMNKNILLFDDILTTGNTMKSVIKVLCEFKPKNIKILALSRPEIS